jgi:hypothetical protein
MKPASQMTAAEKNAFKQRPDVQRESAIAKEYIQMLKAEADAAHNNGKMPTDEFYCLLRGALGFEHPSMRDERAPKLKIIGPYLLEEIDMICKKPRAISLNGHLVVPQKISELNKNFDRLSENNGYLTGGKRRKSKHINSRRQRK